MHGSSAPTTIVERPAVESGWPPWRRWTSQRRRYRDRSAAAKAPGRRQPPEARGSVLLLDHGNDLPTKPAGAQSTRAGAAAGYGDHQKSQEDVEHVQS
jgi:hypothetical protein